ncbi:Bgt-51339 [Blumeria graminis f. sp. tritici]|uniref:Bgt-51339 n=1 Tax=Blumeria graminis f. sp. tritici TaxID=62690 RepID=A0A9X9MGF9_BLUGR|nr:Bgt-51339 [Blumeria graminis f. sp. tritici]
MRDCALYLRGLRFQAPKSWIVRAPSATLTEKVRASTYDAKIEHERDMVERVTYGNKFSGRQWKRWCEHKQRIERQHMNGTG